MHIHIVLVARDSAIPGKVADAELHFDQAEGPLLAGQKLIGFGLWARRVGTGLNVTFPARAYTVNGERRSFALLRPTSFTDHAGDAAQALRQAIIAAYQAVVDPPAAMKTCCHGNHPIDARTLAAGGEVCFDCATNTAAPAIQAPVHAAVRTLEPAPVLTTAAAVAEQAVQAALALPGYQAAIRTSPALVHLFSQGRAATALCGAGTEDGDAPATEDLAQVTCRDCLHRHSLGITVFPIPASRIATHIADGAVPLSPVQQELARIAADRSKR